MLITILDQSITFLPFVLAIYFSYRILGVTDLSAEGAILSGASIFARTLSYNPNELVAFLLAILGGCIIGIFVSLIQKNNKINDLLAGILTLFILQTVNFQILTKPNISLLELDNQIFLIKTLYFLLVLVFIYCLVKSSYGLIFRAFSQNQNLLKNLGINLNIVRTIGLVITNSLAAGTGVLLAKENGYVDIYMTSGFALTAIGTVIIGIELMYLKNNKFSIVKDLLGCISGVLIYFLIINIFIMLDMDPINLKFVIGSLIIFMLMFTKRSGYVSPK